MESMVQEKARRPSFGRSRSISCSFCITASRRESSTMVMMAEAIEGHAWEP